MIGFAAGKIQPIAETGMCTVERKTKAVLERQLPLGFLICSGLFINMKEGSKTVRFILWIALLGCLLILTKFILFKKSPRYYKHYFTNEYQYYSWKKGWKNGNTTPFKSIRLLTGRYVTSEYSYRNIGGNIVGFIPLGLILPVLLTGFRSVFRTTATVFLLSACFELMQLFLGIGAFDVDDLILNTCGGLIGYLIFTVFRLIFPPRETAQS